MADLERLGAIVRAAGGSERDSWVARTSVDRETLRFFRHAVPESVNMLIDERRREEPSITKLGSDMSVPDDRLRDVSALYRSTLVQEGLEAAAWGHIGNNHLHVNVLPRNAEEYTRGKALFARWAQDVTAMGGAVSAEHGVGKLKRDFLTTMYGSEHVREMARLKLAFDPACQLGRGNLFDAALLDEVCREGAAVPEGSDEADAGLDVEDAGLGFGRRTGCRRRRTGCFERRPRCCCQPRCRTCSAGGCTGRCVIQSDEHREGVLMHIVVCVKAVPSSTEVKMDPVTHVYVRQAASRW